MARYMEIYGTRGKYLVSDTGHIYNADTMEQLPEKDKDGYKYVEIRGNREFIHRIVARVYQSRQWNKLAYNKEFITIHHIDKNRANNNWDNLQVLTKEAHETLHRLERLELKLKKEE